MLGSRGEDNVWVNLFHISIFRRILQGRFHRVCGILRRFVMPASIIPLLLRFNEVYIFKLNNIRLYLS